MAQSKIPAMKVDSLVALYQQPGMVVVVNFWSTWCQPCVEEMPHFISVAKGLAKQGVQLWLVSQDSKKLYNKGGLDAFIKRKGWKGSFVWLDETDADYYCPKVDSAWGGAIPATLIINMGKNYRKFFEESLTEDQLRDEIKKAM